MLVALAVPALGMQTSLGGTEDISRDLEVMQTYDRTQAAFPSEGSMEMVVVKADDVTSTEAVSAIDSLETQAQQRSGLFEGQATVEVSSDQTVATVGPHHRERHGRPLEPGVDALRDDLVPATLGQVAVSRPTRPARQPRLATSTTP